MAHRFTVVLTLFAASAAGMIYWGYSQELFIFKDKEKIGGPSRRTAPTMLGNLRYFKSDLRGPHIELRADSLTGDSDAEEVAVTGPRGVLFREEGDSFRFRSSRAHYFSGEKELQMMGGASMSSSSDNLEVRAERVSYFGGEDYFRAEGGVRGSFDLERSGAISLEGERAEGWPGKGRVRYWGDIRGEVRRRHGFEEGVAFSSNEIRLDRDKKLVQMEGNVEMRFRGVVIQARKGEIYLENYNKKLKYYALSDDVKVIESRMGRNRQAYGERLEGHIKERKIVLSGAPRVVQGDGEDIIYGNSITLFEDTGVMEVGDPASRVLLKEREGERK